MGWSLAAVCSGPRPCLSATLADLHQTSWQIAPCYQQCSWPAISCQHLLCLLNLPVYPLESKVKHGLLFKISQMNKF